MPVQKLPLLGSAEMSYRYLSYFKQDVFTGKYIDKWLLKHKMAGNYWSPAIICSSENIILLTTCFKQVVITWKSTSQLLNSIEDAC